MNDETPAKTFICDQCGGEFPLGDDDVAVAEQKVAFPNLKPEDTAIVCDECYQEIMADVTQAN
jgi:uncharacterized protein (DUF2237 family)